MRDCSVFLTPYFKINIPETFNWFDDVAEPLDDVVFAVEFGKTSAYIIPSGKRDERLKVVSFHDYHNQVTELDDLTVYNQKHLYANVYPEVLAYHSAQLKLATA